MLLSIALLPSNFWLFILNLLLLVLITMAKTRVGSSARCSERSFSLRRSKRLKQSVIPGENIVEDVAKDQVNESVPANSSPVHASDVPDAGSPDAL